MTLSDLSWCGIYNIHGRTCVIIAHATHKQRGRSWVTAILVGESVMWAVLGFIRAFQGGARGVTGVGSSRIADNLSCLEVDAIDTTHDHNNAFLLLLLFSFKLL